MKLFLTGVTGFLGGELVVELSKRKEIDKIFCLMRSSNKEKAQKRLEKIFAFHSDYLDKTKIIPVIGDLLDDNLSEKLINDKSLSSVDTVIHSAANTSFSKIYDDIIEKTNINGTQQLLEWAKSLKKLNLFTYIGTASICGTLNKNCLIKEDLSPNILTKHLVKYSYTKMVGEMLLKDYLPEEKTLVLRPSILMGDSRQWIPRSYVILWAIATFNELRLIPVNGYSKADVISIDYAVNSIIQLIMNKRRKYNIYHISSGENSCTNLFLMTDAIKDCHSEKPEFKFVNRKLLSDFKKWSKNTNQINEDKDLFELKDYLDYWIKNFGDNSKLRILFYALEPYLDFVELGQVFDNSRLLQDTNVGYSIPAHIYLRSLKKYLKNIDIFEGAKDP